MEMMREGLNEEKPGAEEKARIKWIVIIGWIVHIVRIIVRTVVIWIRGVSRSVRTVIVGSDGGLRPHMTTGHCHKSDQ